MILLTDNTISPSLLIQKRIAVLKKRNRSESSGLTPRIDTFALAFSHKQYYLPGQPLLALVAIISIQLDYAGSVCIEGSIVAPISMTLYQELQSITDDYASVHQYCLDQGFPWMEFTAPWLLSPVQIPKPWGREVWFTGIEERGQSGVNCEGGSLPLPWVLSIFPQSPCDQGDDVILLKVLDPLPDEIYGDLYLELHEQKQEVYVVTHVDPQAWPEGVGRIQLGFDQTVRHSYGNDEIFKQSYLEAVQNYEQVRRALDDVFERKKAAATFTVNQLVTAELLKHWIKELSQDIEIKALMQKEGVLRNRMNSFIESYPLHVGDWVKIPRYMPHSLQHGVRVVEFQTPVYERRILSFAQQVQTQSHWDTEVAVHMAELGAYEADQPQLLESPGLNSIERIASFDDFEVRRVELRELLELSANQYSLLMVLEGEVLVRAGGISMHIENGQAVLLPVNDNGWQITSINPTLLLHARPFNAPTK